MSRPASARATPDAAASEIRVQVRRQLVDEWYANVVAQCAAVVLITPLWAALFYWRQGRASILVWLGAVVASQLVRLGLNLRYRRRGDLQDDPVRRERQAVWTVGFNAVVFAAGHWIIFDAGDPVFTSLLTFWYLASIMLAVPIHSMIKPVLVAYCLIIGFTVCIRNLLGAELLYVTSGLSCLAVALMCIHYGLRGHRMHATALELGVRNSSLARDLERQVAIAVRANEEKTRFLAAASHDMRQPLHALSLFGDALRRKLALTEHAGDLDKLMLSVEALGNSLHGMMDISRLDAGGVPVRMQCVDLNAVFASIRETHMDKAEDKQLALRFRSGGLRVAADPQLLQRLVGNLVANALRYTERGGVFVGARLRRGADRQVQIEIRDSGPGIPAGFHEAIFKEFFQLNNPGRDRSRGFGIGLSIVQRLAAAQQMRVQVRSAEGCGSTFFVHCRQAAPSDFPPTAASAGQSVDLGFDDSVTREMLKGLRILVVDDETAILDAVEHLLTPMGAQVARASSAAQAFMHVRSNDVDLVIADHRLPHGLGGVGLGTALGEAAQKSIPFIVVTGETDPQVMGTMRASGARICIKPLSADALMRAIAEVLATHPVGWGGGRPEAPTVNRRVLPEERVELSAGNADLVFERLSPQAILATLSGIDAGQFGTAAFEEIRSQIHGRPPVRLFVDARDFAGSPQVSKDWVHFFYSSRHLLESVTVLAGSRALELIVAIEQNRPHNDDLIRIYAGGEPFDAAVAAARKPG
jgi:signal transduction histidine kinase/CheY-like chemotaxis protein